MVRKKKVVFGQYFTKEKLWLKPQVVDFIRKSGCSVAYDPFAGEGHLLDSVKCLEFKDVVGLDIDESLGWRKNDSLKKIPHFSDNAIIITNPPYLTNYSASRKKIMREVKKYFKNSEYDDLYLIALERMLEAQKYVVAIIPETFINARFEFKNLLSSITILEENPFFDTDAPVVIACFDGRVKGLDEVKIYKNDVCVSDLECLENMRLLPKNNVEVNFNAPNGWLAVRCVDTTNPKEMLRFGFKSDIDYDWAKGIKVSSRLMTLVDLQVKEEDRPRFIQKCNEILNDFRYKTGDITLSPFKGNMQDGRRRRRLDFKTCRAIIEMAYEACFSKSTSGR